jgi:hypothetical protein
LDHIIAQQHGGKSTRANLAASCAFCNANKGPNLAGIDPRTKQLTRLFNPRTDRWADHFRWHDAYLVGLTPIGRVTVYVMAVNDPERLPTRASLMAEGCY